MKAIFATVVSVALLFASIPSPAAEVCERVLDDISEIYGTLPGMSMDYNREVVTRALSPTGEKITGDFAEGRIYFKPPHFIKMIQHEPAEEQLITEGRNVWWYIPDKERVERYPASFFGKQLSLLGDIFQGFPDGHGSFECRASELNGDTVLVLKPDPPWKDVDHVAVTVDRYGSIGGIGIRNHLGNVTRFTFGPITVEDSLDEDFFTFRMPDDMWFHEHFHY